MIYVDLYKEKFGVAPQIPFMQSNGEDDRFAEMVMMAIKPKRTTTSTFRWIPMCCIDRIGALSESYEAAQTIRDEEI